MQTSLPLIKIIDQFIYEQDISARSRETYKASLLHFFFWIASKEKYNPTKEQEVRTITRSMVIHYKRDHEERNISNCSIHLYLTVLRKFFKWTDQIGYHKNVTDGIKSPKKYKGFKKEPLTIDEAKALINIIPTDTPKGKRDKAMILLMLYCGLRVIEVSRCDIKDISNKEGKTILYIQGKGRTWKDEFIVLEDIVFDAIHEYLLTKSAFQETDPLFTSFAHGWRHHRLTTVSIRLCVNKYLRDIGIKSKHITTHSLRHTAAVIIIEQNGTLYDTQLFLRHSNAVITQIYTRYVEQKKLMENKAGKILSHALSNDNKK